MTTDLLQRYGGAVPRYTSYPTAPHFHDGINADVYADWLAALPADQPVSLYLHVPFCQRMCWYCGCHTKVVGRYEPIHDYAETLAREADLVADALPGRLRVSHLHFGGGSPTTLSEDDFRMIMARLGQRFDFVPDAELAVEIDPRTMTDAMAEALAESGINRISFGVQDFNTKVQEAINRVQSFDDTKAVLDILRRHGINAVNLDLMYGLPHQGVADAERTVDLAVDLGPDRLSVFGYAHVPWMKTHQKMIDEVALPGAAERFEQAEAVARRLAEHGYVRIGLDHFARSDDPMAKHLQAGELRRNFQGYTTDQASSLIGMGASAIGSLPQGYVQNAPSIRAWRRAIDAGGFAVERGLELDPTDRLRRDIIERLMCELHVDLAPFETKDGAPDDGFAAERARLMPMADDGLVNLDGAHVAVTEAGRPFVRSVCAVFDTYLQTGKGRHSAAV